MPSLSSVFLFLTVVGGVGVLLQGIGAMLGFDGGASDSPDDVELHASHGLHEIHHEAAHAGSALSVFNFRSIRAIATGIFFTGLGGLLALRSVNGVAATAIGILLGLVMYLGVAFVMRGFARLDADHSVHPLRAVGLEATVSLPIPAPGHGPGKVVLVVGGRRVEWPAIQSAGAPPDEVISSGSSVQIVDAADDTTLTVVALSRTS
jgi:hypothetical protein